MGNNSRASTVLEDSEVQVNELNWPVTSQLFFCCTNAFNTEIKSVAEFLKYQKSNRNVLLKLNF